MSDTTFSAGTVVPSTWLNDVNDFTYKSWFVNASAFGALNDGTTNNTAAVQLALDSLETSGGIVQVSPNTKFNLQSLVFPQRSNLEFRMDDDLSRPNPSTTLGTNERVLFQANANAGGIVNEHRITASFHPSMNIDVRRDVAGHDAHLGAGQVRVPTSSVPARASFNIFDQQVDAYRTAYEIFGGDYSNFSGVTSHGWRRTVTITGVGTGAGGFVSVPAVGTEVTGSVSGAKGWFLSATTTTTTLLWNSGKFAAGDALIDNNETTVNTASSVAFAIEPLQSFGQDLRRGNWSFGLPVGAGTDLLSVGGRVALLPTRTFSQYVDKTITHPGLVLSDLVSDVPTNGFVVHYDTTAAAASRRLTVRKISSATEETTEAAHLNACRAHCNFGNAGGVSTSAFNVASVTRTGTGRYDIVFSRAMERNDYSVSISLEEASTKGGYPLSKTTSGFTLAVATLGGTTAVDLTAAVSIVIHGGDI
jgi:hypothetical protein